MPKKFSDEHLALLKIVDKRLQRAFPSFWSKEVNRPLLEEKLDNVTEDINQAITEAFNDADFYDGTEIKAINEGLVSGLEETINERNYFNEESLSDTENALNNALSGKVAFDEQFNKVTITEENGILITGEHNSEDVARINLRGVGETSDNTNFAGIHIQKNLNPSGTADWKSMFWANTEGDLFLEGNLQPGSILTGTTEEGVIIDPELGVAVLSNDVRITLNGASNSLGDDSYAGISVQKRINNTGVEADDWQLNFYTSPEGDVFFRGNAQLEDGSLLVGTNEEPVVFISQEDTFDGIVVTGESSRTIIGEGYENHNTTFAGIAIEGKDEQDNWISNFYADSDGNVFLRGEIQANKGFLGDLEVQGILQSSNYVENEEGFLIEGSTGDAYFNNIFVRGDDPDQRYLRNFAGLDWDIYADNGMATFSPFGQDLKFSTSNRGSVNVSQPDSDLIEISINIPDAPESDNYYVTSGEFEFENYDPSNPDWIPRIKLNRSGFDEPNPAFIDLRPMNDYLDNRYNNYTHPTGFSDSNTYSGATVISQIQANNEGHFTGVSTRELDVTDIGGLSAGTGGGEIRTNTQLDTRYSFLIDNNGASSETFNPHEDRLRFNGGDDITTSVSRPSGEDDIVVTINLDSSAIPTNKFVASGQWEDPDPNVAGFNENIRLVYNTSGGGDSSTRIDMEPMMNYLDDTYAPKSHSDITSGNPHGITKSTVDLGNVSNYGNSDSFSNNSSTTYATSKAVRDHHILSNNPHDVTKSQVGLGNLINTLDLDDYDNSNSNFTTLSAVASVGYMESFGVSSGATTADFDIDNGNNLLRFEGIGDATVTSHDGNTIRIEVDSSSSGERFVDGGGLEFDPSNTPNYAVRFRLDYSDTTSHNYIDFSGLDSRYELKGEGGISDSDNVTWTGDHRWNHSSGYISFEDDFGRIIMRNTNASDGFWFRPRNSGELSLTNDASDRILDFFHDGGAVNRPYVFLGEGDTEIHGNAGRFAMAGTVILDANSGMGGALSENGVRQAEWTGDGFEVVNRLAVAVDPSDTIGNNVQANIMRRLDIIEEDGIQSQDAYRVFTIDFIEGNNEVRLRTTSWSGVDRTQNMGFYTNGGSRVMTLNGSNQSVDFHANNINGVNNLRADSGISQLRFEDHDGTNLFGYWKNEGEFRVFGDADFTGTSSASNHIGNSDKRIKFNFKQISGLEIIRNAGNLYSYEKEGIEGREVGQFAQDLLHCKDLVGTRKHDKYGEIYTLSGMSLAGVAMNGVKELDIEFQDHLTDYSQTKSEVDILKDRVKELEQEIETLRRN